MADIKKLHKIIQEMGSDPNVSMHELVREVLKQDNDFSEYYLDNISEPDGEKINDAPPEDHAAASENTREVQAKLEKFLEEDQQRSKATVQERETTHKTDD